MSMFDFDANPKKKITLKKKMEEKMFSPNVVVHTNSSLGKWKGMTWTGRCLPLGYTM